MPITTAYAVISTRDLDQARRWWTQLIGREPDRVPMPNDVEWSFPAGGGLQLVEDAERAGKSSLTLAADVDATLAEIARHGVEVPQAQTVPSGHPKIAMLADPDGNTVVLAQETSG